MWKISLLLISFTSATAHDYIHEPMQYDSRNNRGAYRYGYDTGLSGSHQFHQENKDSTGRVSGKYGYTGPDGKLRLVRYTAGVDGFRAWSNDDEHGSDKANGVVDTSNTLNKRSYNGAVPEGSWLVSNTDWKTSEPKPPSPSRAIQKTYNAYSHQNLEENSKTSRSSYVQQQRYTKTSPPKLPIKAPSKISPPKQPIVQQQHQIKDSYVEQKIHTKTSPPKQPIIQQQHVEKTSPPKPAKVVQQTKGAYVQQQEQQHQVRDSYTKTAQYQSKSQYIDKDDYGKTSPPKPQKFTQQKETSDYRSGRTGTFHTNYSYQSPAARYRFTVDHPPSPSAYTSSTNFVNSILDAESQRVPRCVCY